MTLPLLDPETAAALLCCTPETIEDRLRDGEGRPPSASVLLGIYDGLTYSRKGDLLECAQVIALAP